jgi:hypothetical protein
MQIDSVSRPLNLITEDQSLSVRGQLGLLPRDHPPGRAIAHRPHERIQFAV